MKENKSIVDRALERWKTLTAGAVAVAVASYALITGAGRPEGLHKEYNRAAKTTGSEALVRAENSPDILIHGKDGKFLASYTYLQNPKTGEEHLFATLSKPENTLFRADITPQGISLPENKNIDFSRNDKGTGEALVAAANEHVSMRVLGDGKLPVPLKITGGMVVFPLNANGSFVSGKVNVIGRHRPVIGTADPDKHNFSFIDLGSKKQLGVDGLEIIFTKAPQAIIDTRPDIKAGFVVTRSLLGVDINSADDLKNLRTPHELMPDANPNWVEKAKVAREKEGREGR